jgi:hypothetical protein
VDELVEDLRERHGAIDWWTELLVDRLVNPPAPTTEILDAARRRLLEGDWDLGVVVTDLPLRLGRRPVSRHVSPTHGLAGPQRPAQRCRIPRSVLPSVSARKPFDSSGLWAAWSLARSGRHRPERMTVSSAMSLERGPRRLG